MDDVTIKELAEKAELRTAARIGAKRPYARARLAEACGLTFWTFDNWRRGRIKRAGEIEAKIKAGLAAEIEREIEGLRRDLETLRACGGNPTQAQVESLRRAVADGQKLLGEMGAK